MDIKEKMQTLKDEGRKKDILAIFSAIATAPSECADCVAFCAEGRIS